MPYPLHVGLVQIFGVALVSVGLLLFFHQQWGGKTTGEESGIKAWQLNLSGPPALILVVFGTAVFLFPFSPWWPEPDDPNPPVTTTVEALTTTTEGFKTTSTLFTLDTLDTDDFDEFVPTFGLPSTPTGPSIWYDDQCGGESVEWFQDDAVWGWYISVETDTQIWEIDTQVDPLLYGNDSILCYWDFGSDPAPPYYWMWVYAYNEAGYSEEPLFIEYLP